MRNIVRNVINGGEAINLKEIGILGSEIKRVYTIIDEYKFNFNPYTGEKITLENDNAYLGHLENVFLEDHFHDWRVNGDLLYFYSHSGSIGEIHDLLIIWENLQS